jgi:DNA-binding response OmpR family regulator
MSDNTQRVTAVDDDRRVRDLVTRDLTGQGFRVEAVRGSRGCCRARAASWSRTLSCLTMPERR